ncbi:MAG: hypothetical protein U1E02_10520 [Hydrogenophaga sp.]|nr:hypothetical protein [Hydrogenophaga sp.]
MQDDIPKNPKRQKAMHVPEVENTKSASVRELLAKSLSREFVIDCEKLIARVATTNPHEALLCELMLIYGLRLSEALNLKPHESITPAGLLIKQGTKDGRSRLIPFAKLPSTVHRQRQVYSRCLQHSKKAAGNSMGYEGLSKDRSYRRFEGVLAIHHISTSSMQITYRDLRHAHERLMFEDYMGYRKPAKSQNELESMCVNSLEVKAAIKAVMQTLGNSPSAFTLVWVKWPQGSGGPKF